MLRARTNEGTILFGMTDGNLRLLRDGRPIIVEGDELGLGGVRVVIFWGEDGPALCRKLKEAGCELPPGAEELAALNEFPNPGGPTQLCPECGGAVWTRRTD